MNKTKQKNNIYKNSIQRPTLPTLLNQDTLDYILQNKYTPFVDLPKARIIQVEMVNTENGFSVSHSILLITTPLTRENLVIPR